MQLWPAIRFPYELAWYKIIPKPIISAFALPMSALAISAIACQSADLRRVSLASACGGPTANAAPHQLTCRPSAC